MYDSLRLVLAGLARWFVDNNAQRSIHYYQAHELVTDDPLKYDIAALGKVVKVTFEYAPASEIESEA